MDFRTTSQFLISAISPVRLFYGFSLIWFRVVSFEYILLKVCLYIREVLANGPYLFAGYYCVCFEALTISCHYLYLHFPDSYHTAGH